MGFFGIRYLSLLAKINRRLNWRKDDSHAAKPVPSDVQVEFTNVDKLYWKKEKITKGQLIDYYLSVSPYILPHLKGRAQSLHRFPEGIEGNSFIIKMQGKTHPHG